MSENRSRKKFLTSSYLRAWLGKNISKAEIIASIPVKTYRVRELLGCRTCKRQFLNLAALSIHLLQQCISPHDNFDQLSKSPKGTTKNEKFICNLCGASFTFKKGIKNHLEGVHFPKTKIICTICGKISKTKYVHAAHELIHGPQPTFLCTICGHRFFQAAGLSVHIKNVHHQASYPCRFCDQVFNKAAARYTHEYAHKYPDSLKCKTCDRKFTQRSALNTHIKNCHPELAQLEKKFICSECDKVYHMKKYLLDHIVSVNRQTILKRTVFTK